MLLCWILTPVLILFYALPAAAMSIRIAVIQLSSAKDGDFATMLGEARNAKAAGAQLIVFPEASDIGWLNPRTFYDATPVPGAVTENLAKIAVSTGLWVVAGITERGNQVSQQPPTYEAFDSAVMIDPTGSIVLHHRQFNVVKNAFSICPIGVPKCGYTPGKLTDIKVVTTPFGVVGLLVCDDAFIYETASLDALKPYRPTLVIVTWGVTAGSEAECGKKGFNATGYAAEAASYLGTAHVVGANATGQRTYGRFLPSWYCGTSGFAEPNGTVGGVTNTQDEMGIFDVPIAP